MKKIVNPEELWSETYRTMDIRRNWLFNNFGKLWVLSVALSLGVTAFVLWLLYKVVMHITGG